MKKSDNVLSETTPQWELDYRLQDYPAMGMFAEYLEMGQFISTSWCF